MISIQPTTKFVEESPIVNTDNFVLKKDLVTELAKKADKSALDTKTDSKDVERISTNLITSNLTDYCKKDELTKGLENKSNTNHTHTTINNDLTINSNGLKLYSSKGAYTTLHTHTVCVPYYKAAPYNISHTKNFLMAIFTLIFFL